LFDENGSAQNPLDDNRNRHGSGGVALSTYSSHADVRFDLDRLVESGGSSNAPSSIPVNQPFIGPLRRDSAFSSNMAGPLVTTLAGRFANPAPGIVLNS
jgi:hypothetical protein